jgi:hypothetical protein
MTRRLITSVAALVLVAAVVAGCDSEDKKNYNVTITWNVAGGQGTTCVGTLSGPGVAEQVEFDNVAVTVYSAADDTTPIQQTVEVPCTDYEYTIPRLKRGNYIVELGAMAEYDGDYLPYYQAELTVAAPQKQQEYQGMLVQGMGKILASWSFDNMKMCGANDVTEVEISLYDGSDTILCEDGEVLVEDLYWAEYSLTVVGLDSEGAETWSGECEDNPFEVKPGEIYEAHAVLGEN